VQKLSCTDPTLHPDAVLRLLSYLTLLPVDIIHIATMHRELQQ
jgi:hypothetical protein